MCPRVTDFTLDSQQSSLGGILRALGSPVSSGQSVALLVPFTVGSNDLVGADTSCR
jgi:hypothetical protein